MSADVVAAVVSYRPEESVLHNVRALASQVATTIIVDNASGADYEARLAQLAGVPRVELVRNAENRGVAGALNQAAARARELGATWLATFDQDSHAPETYLRALTAGLADDRQAQKIAVVAPVHHDVHLSPAVAGETSPRAITTAMTSGCLMRLAALAEAGDFREDFFLDYVDHELCLRLRYYGWRIVQVPTAVLDHQLGHGRVHSLLGMRIHTTNHGPDRRYAMARNRIRLYREYAWREPTWVLEDALGSAREFIKVAIFEDQRFAKSWASVRGFFSGLAAPRTEGKP